MKRLILIVILLVSCSSPERKTEYAPSSQNGCVQITDVRSRLACIGRLVKQLEGIRNAKITVDSEELDRIDSEYVNTRETYCFTSHDGSDKFLCFETEIAKYSPTLLGQVKSIGSKFLFGYIFGMATGLVVSH